MRHLRCKCGKMTMSTSMGAVKDCEGCSQCKTTYSGHPDNHKKLLPHDWAETTYHQNTGKPYKTCKRCHRINNESYEEAGKKR